MNDRIVLTLDAGGTNFVFTAVQSGQLIVDPVTLPSNAHDLGLCLNTMVRGFEETMKHVPRPPDAISFAFPGPADYELGIINKLPNLKAFDDDVAVGPMLGEKFGLPVFINNDGNLYAYGEALAGYLPELNERIRKQGGVKQFRNLIGLTLGTGFGCGFVIDGRLLVGDNSCDSGVYLTPNKFRNEWNGEESVSTRAIQRVYCEGSGRVFSAELMPKDIYEIACGDREGDREAAVEAYRQFGEGLGYSITNLLTLIDGIVVIGGGIVYAWPLFAPAMFQEISRNFETLDGTAFPRLPFRVFNLEDSGEFDGFVSGEVKKLAIPGSEKTIEFDRMHRVGIAVTRLGASKAISLGAWAYANTKLDEAS
jgi:glucokinase